MTPPDHVGDDGTPRAGDGAPALSVSRLRGVLDGTYVRPGEPLRRWKTKLAQTPDTAVIAVVGDSTSDPATGSYAIYQRLYGLHTQQGEALYGMAPNDLYADGATTSGSPTFTSASANFTSADVGRLLFGVNLPGGAVISSVQSTTSVTLSVNATGTGTGQQFYIGRKIIGGGNNGLSLSNWFASPAGAFPFNRAALVSANPDLIIYSWLINDVRLGALGTTVATIVPNAIALLKSLIDWTQTTLPNADILLRMPNALLTADVGSSHYVQDAQGGINPAGLAQIYSTALREAYLYFKGYAPGIDVLDTQARVFGTQSLASHPMMTDQLHPTTKSSSINLTPLQGGYVAIADEIVDMIGNRRNAFPVGIAASRYRQEFLVTTGGAGFLDLTAKHSNAANAAQAPIAISDTLYVSGFTGPLALTSATISRPFGGTSIRITGLTGNDFTNYTGRVAVVTGAHPDATTGDRQVVSVDLPSIAAGATVTQTIAVTGARTGALSDATAVLCTPPAAFITGGLYLTGCYPSANDTVTLVVTNPTGGAVDIAAANFAFWVVR